MFYFVIDNKNWVPLEMIKSVFFVKKSSNSVISQFAHSTILAVILALILLFWRCNESNDGRGGGLL